MMNQKGSENRHKKHFWCYTDSHYWATEDYCEPGHTGCELDDSGAEDPLNYYARCPICKEWTRAVPHYYANLPKMKTTGPRTEEGKRRSSLNGFKHGRYARPHHLLAPATGKYDICAACEDQDECKAGKIKYCPYKLDLMARVIAAYENGKLDDIKSLAGITQGRMYLVIENMLGEVMNKGVLLKNPVIKNGELVRYDHDGEEQTLYEYMINPLIKELPKVMGAAGLTSDQQKMNPARQEENSEELRGHLKEPTDPVNFLNSMKDLVDSIRGGSAPDIAKAMREADPVYQEYSQEGESDEDEDIEVGGENPFN
ncbi:MAG: hypothetical protein WCQ59_09120 [Candidatus Cloacimonadaceae bacterium]